jgi:hypothetical protein
MQFKGKHQSRLYGCKTYMAASEFNCLQLGPLHNPTPAAFASCKLTKSIIPNRVARSEGSWGWSMVGTESYWGDEVISLFQQSLLLTHVNPTPAAFTSYNLSKHFLWFPNSTPRVLIPISPFFYDHQKNFLFPLK